MFSFQLRTVVGNLGFLPKTDFVLGPDSKSLVIVSSWGSPGLAAEIGQLISSEINQPPGTSEETVMRGAAPSLPSPEQKIKQAIEKAHNELFKKNSSEYKEGVEVAVFLQSAQQIYFCQTGGPQVFSVSNQGDISMLVAAANMNPSATQLSPLPTALLGVEKTFELSTGQFPADLNPTMIFSSLPFIPKKLTSVKSLDLQKIIEVYANSNHQMPFWIGFSEIA